MKCLNHILTNANRKSHKKRVDLLSMDKQAKFAGKTLLMLGSNIMSKEVVQYAKAHGAYVIVTDNLPIEKSNAKRYADETASISTMDIDALTLYARDKHVDGVFAGISEFNLLSAMEISTRLGLRFYCNRKQWNQIERKNEFRELCIQFGVPCPKVYFSGIVSALSRENKAGFKYPLVVKPVDCAASVGVSICYDAIELEKAIVIAGRESGSNQIIIEEFIKGNEFTAHYIVCNEKARLSCIDNRFPVAVNTGTVTTIPIARIYPSTYLKEYREFVDERMVSLCESIGLKNAVIFIQGFFNEENGQFAIFEAGLRSAAEAPCRLIERITNQNYVYMLIDSILLGATDYSLEDECPDFGGRCGGIVSFVTKGGRVGSISGLEETVKETDSILFYESRYPEGTVTPSGNTLRQLMIRFGILCNDRVKMMEDVRYINGHVSVLNDLGENMVLKMDPSRIVTEFTGYSR